LDKIKIQKKVKINRLIFSSLTTVYYLLPTTYDLPQKTIR
jgi:hypothetical protein